MYVTVRRGDSLWAIASRAKVSLAELIKANPGIRNPRLIYSGQRVALPGSETGSVGSQSAAPPSSARPRHVVVQRGDSLWVIAQRAGVPLAALVPSSGQAKKAPAPAPAPKETGGGASPRPGGDGRPWVAEALRNPVGIFKQQYRSRFNPTGPLRSSNCGPASLAMAVKAFGLEPKGLTVEQSIDRTRRHMTGNTDDGDAVNEGEILRGALRLGLKAKGMSRGGLDAQLAAGRMVVLTGRPVGAYRTGFPGYPSFTGFHAILVVGKTASGYVVNDPLSRRGPVRLSREQLAAYWSHGGGSGIAVWR